MRIRTLFFFRRFHIPTFIIVLLLLGLVLMSLRVKQRQGVAFFDAFLLEITTPAQRAATFIIKGIQGVFEHYIFLIHLERENDLIKKRVAELQEENSQMKEMVLANDRLRNLLQFREKMPTSVIVAEVIGQDPTSWFKSVTINKGEQDGVQKGMAVILPEGIVGQILKTSLHYATVLLITDYNSAVDAVIQRTRAKAIVEGKEENRCQLKYLLRTDEVVVGDVAVTSGLGGIFPKGLMIGEIRSVDKKSHGVFQHAELVPSVDLTKLEEVLVLSASPIPPPQPEQKEKKVMKVPSGSPKKR
jgi:rod shape-determining protein MreC